MEDSAGGRSAPFGARIVVPGARDVNPEAGDARRTARVRSCIDPAATWRRMNDSTTPAPPARDARYRGYNRTPNRPSIQTSPKYNAAVATHDAANACQNPTPFLSNAGRMRNSGSDARTSQKMP